MKVVHPYRIVIVQDENVVFSCPAKIEDGRAKYNFLAEVKRERTHEASEPVYHIYLRAGPKEKLNLSVGKIIDIGDRSA